jgi:hypothetical protein
MHVTFWSGNLDVGGIIIYLQKRLSYDSKVTRRSALECDDTIPSLGI